MAIIVGIILNFPACKTIKDIYNKSVTRMMYLYVLISLLYLAVDHYIKANSKHFIQSAIRFTILILVIPGISVGHILVDLKRKRWK